MRGNFFGDSGDKAEIDKARLNKIRTDFEGEEFCEEMYYNYKDRFPYSYGSLSKLDDEELKRVLHASAYYLHINAESMLSNNETIDIKSLNQFLNRPIHKAFNSETKQYLQSTHGLGFLNSFIKNQLLSVKVAGKSDDIITRSKRDFKWLYKVVCKTLAFKQDLKLSSFLSSMRLVDSQTVSNFRPQTAAYIFWRYAVKDNPNKDIYIKVPSEGWLGRLLASYYIAWNYREKNIHYHSIDPNPDVAKAFNEVVEYLKNYGGISKVTNWFPKLHHHGSNEESAALSRKLGVKFDLSFTSPPYGFHEKYSRGFFTSFVNTGIKYNDGILESFDKNGEPLKLGRSELRERVRGGENFYDSEGRMIAGTKTISETEEIFNLDKNKKTNIIEIYPGTRARYENQDIQILKKVDTGQSHSLGTVFGWNELFFRPTQKYVMEDVKPGGYIIWNVANVRTHKTLEEDVVRICEESGAELVDTQKYMLSRVPGSALRIDKETGERTRINIKDIKDSFEPVFVFRRP